jgi:hypothetical protein
MQGRSKTLVHQTMRHKSSGNTLIVRYKTLSQNASPGFPQILWITLWKTLSNRPKTLMIQGFTGRCLIMWQKLKALSINVLAFFLYPEPRPRPAQKRSGRNCA